MRQLYLPIAWTLIAWVAYGQAFFIGYPPCYHKTNSQAPFGKKSRRLALPPNKNVRVVTTKATPKDSEIQKTTSIQNEDMKTRPISIRTDRSSYNSRRMNLFRWLNQPTVEIVAVLAVLLSCFLVAIDTLEYMNPIHPWIETILMGINVLFALDFFARWYAAGNFKPLYLTKPLVALDVLVILVPLFLTLIVNPLLLWTTTTMGDSFTDVATTTASFMQDDTHDWWFFFLDPVDSVSAQQLGGGWSAGLQNLLLLRILRLRRVLTDSTTFGRFVLALGLKPKFVRPYQLQLARVLLSIFTLLSVASGLIYSAEHGVNPDIPDYFCALYFGLTTLTTVGFGDIHPITAQGRLIVCVSILAGVAVIPAQAAKLVDALIEYQDDLKRPTRISRAMNTSPPPRVDSYLVSNDTPLTTVLTTTLAGQDIDNVMFGDASQDDPYIGWLGRCCLECEATDHREDASFCWSCGSKL